jgi:hypothetical protein
MYMAGFLDGVMNFIKPAQNAVGGAATAVGGAAQGVITWGLANPPVAIGAVALAAVGTVMAVNHMNKAKDEPASTKWRDQINQQRQMAAGQHQER